MLRNHGSRHVSGKGMVLHLVQTIGDQKCVQGVKRSPCYNLQLFNFKRGPRQLGNICYTPTTTRGNGQYHQRIIRITLSPNMTMTLQNYIFVNRFNYFIVLITVLQMSYLYLYSHRCYLFVKFCTATAFSSQHLKLLLYISKVLVKIQIQAIFEKIFFYYRKVPGLW